MNDVFEYLFLNLVESENAFKLANYLVKENEYLPWSIAFKKFSHIRFLLDTTQIYGEFQNYVTKLIRPIYGKLGWNENQNEPWQSK